LKAVLFLLSRRTTATIIIIFPLFGLVGFLLLRWMMISLLCSKATELIQKLLNRGCWTQSLGSGLPDEWSGYLMKHQSNKKPAEETMSPDLSSQCSWAMHETKIFFFLYVSLLLVASYNLIKIQYSYNKTKKTLSTHSRRASSNFKDQNLCDQKKVPFWLIR
jgi:hypothetical protein